MKETAMKKESKIGTETGKQELKQKQELMKKKTEEYSGARKKEGREEGE